MISLRKNLFYNLLFTATNILYPLASFAYVSRILGPTTLGKVNFATALVSYFVLMASFGIPLYGAREIARIRSNPHDVNKTFSELFVINVASTFGALALFGLLFALLPALLGEKRLFLVLSSMILLNALSIDWMYQGLENYRFISARNFVIKTVFLLLLVLLVRSESDYLLYAALSVASMAVYNLVAIVNCRRYAQLTLKNLSLGRHMRPIALLFGSALTASVYVYLDTVLLGMMAGNKAVGLYSAAIKIDKVIVAMITSVGSVIVPRVSYYLEQSLDVNYRRVAQKSVHFMYLVAFPSAVGVAVLAPQIMAAVAGPKFGAAVPALRIASLLIPVIGFTNFLGIQILVSNRQENGLFWATLAASVCNICLNLLLIPRFAQNGAAIASVSAEVTALVVIVLWAGRGFVQFRIFDSQSVKYLLLSVCMGLLLFPLPIFFGGGPLFLACFCLFGAAVYFCGLLALRDKIAVEIVRTVAGSVRKIAKTPA